MYQAVIDNWEGFNQKYEGRILSMYLDIKGLVSTGVGNLIDASQSGSPTPWAPALPLAWRKKDGTPATQDEIRAAWSLLKSHQEYAHRSTAAAAALTGLFLTDADVDALVAKKLSDNQAFLVAHHFPFFEQFPADAQMGILSMAWASGADFPRKFPKFKTHVLAGDWLGARDECTLDETGNAGLIPRNLADRVCFANAEIVLRCAMPRDQLCWPNVAQSGVPASEHPANLGTLVVTALEDARNHALEVSRLEALREMSDNEDTNQGEPNA